MERELSNKYAELQESIGKLDDAIVAFSGGIDSALLLKVAHDVLGSKAVAVTADSPSLPRKELLETQKLAMDIGASHLVIRTNETENWLYLKNPGNRCYYCKSELYSKLKTVCASLGISNILNGTIVDDMNDYRPGLAAAQEHNVMSPLRDAGFTKDDVRKLARHLGLSIWDKPSSPCLSSRVPYGHEITLLKLKMIEQAEEFLRQFGINQLRVRHFGSVARIEVNGESREIISRNCTSIKKKFNEIGFEEIDVQQFRSGALNVMLNVHP